MNELDRTDRRILRALQADGRITNAELASRIGLAPSSLGERLKRLQKEGYITGSVSYTHLTLPTIYSV